MLNHGRSVAYDGNTGTSGQIEALSRLSHRYGRSVSQNLEGFMKARLQRCMVGDKQAL